MAEIKVLVVEDEKSVARDIQKSLEGFGYEVSAVVSSGEAAIRKAKEQNPDLVLMDVVLAGEMDGIAAAQQIHDLLHIPVVYLAADIDQEKLETAKLTEPFGYIPKPFQEKELKITVEMALYKAHAEDKLKALIEQLERKNRDLQRNQESFHNIVEKNTDGTVVVDQKGIIRFVNASAESLFGREAGILQGQLFGFPVVTGEMIEINIIRSNGQKGIAEMRMRETKWEDEPAYLVSIRDVTEFKEMERIKAKIDEHVRMNHLKDEFISTVSHELRTPLTTMKEFTSIMADEIAGTLTTEQKEYVYIIGNNIDRLARLINDLLDISKIEAGKIKPKRVLAEIASLAREALSELTPAADRKHIKFKTLFPASAPNIYLDPDRIKEVFVNLINNAIKFTPKNGKITIEIKDEKDRLECSVADTGIGIAPENLGKIFGRFQQFGRPSGPGAQGTGLGLAIAKQLVEMHHGRIWVESELDQGSKFIFTLPKHTRETLFREYVDDGIKGAKKKNVKLSLIVIGLFVFNMAKKKLEANGSPILTNELEEAVKNSLRPGDSTVIADTCEIIVILPDCNKDNALRVLGRLEQIIDGFKAGQSLTPKLELRFGCATYPDEAKSSDELLAKARAFFGE
jgi:PAS domain S-box-containing protein